MKRSYWLALGVLVILVLTGVILRNALSPDDRYVVSIHNKSDHALTNVRVFGGGCDEHFDNIIPDETAQRSFRIKQDGKLEFSAHGDSLNGPTVLSKVISNHVDHNREGMSTVTVDSDGDISAINEKGN